MKDKDEILTFFSDHKTFFRKRFNIVSIGLFGSYSRGDETDDSDIDLLVEFEEYTPDLYGKKRLLKDYIKKHLGLKTDICREKYIKPRLRPSILKETQYAYQGSK